MIDNNLQNNGEISAHEYIYSFTIGYLVINDFLERSEALSAAKGAGK